MVEPEFFLRLLMHLLAGPSGLDGSRQRPERRAEPMKIA
jgi:hypothetical protein